MRFGAVVGGSLAFVGLAALGLGTWELTPWLSGAGLMVALAPHMLRRGVPLARIAHLVNFALLIAATAVTPFIGGIYSVTIPGLALLPLLTAFMIGARAATQWALACGLVVAVFTGIEYAGVQFHHIIPESRRPLSYGFSLLIVFAGVTLFARSYAHFRQQAELRLAQAAKLASMLHRLAGVEASVRRAVDTLSASQGGLPFAVNSHARDGRRATGEAADSVARLLFQHEHLAELVEQLVMTSESINSLLAANKRIGRRLEVLSLNASLEAAKVDEAAFGLVAAEIGRVTAAATEEFVRMERVAASFGSFLQRVQELQQDSSGLTEDVRDRMSHSQALFAELATLSSQLVSAANTLKSESGNHLTAVREAVSQARGLETNLTGS